MEKNFINNFIYSCEQIIANNNRINLMGSFHEINQTEIKECLDALSKKPTRNSRVPKTTIEKASIFIYELLNHKISKEKPEPLACVALLLYLYEHNLWLKIDNRDLYDLFNWIKFSNMLTKKETLSGINKVLEKHSFSL